MGKALFYCFKCSRLLREDDLDRGKAFRVGDRVACGECAKSIPELQNAAPPPPKPRSSSQHLRVPSYTPSRPTPALSPSRRNPLPFVVGGAALLVLAVVGALLSSGSKTSPEAARREKAVEDPREAAARAALEAARKAGSAAALDDVVWKHPDTAAARSAATERDRLRAQLDDRLRAAERDLDARLAAPLSREAFGEALRLVDEAEASNEAPRWKLEMGRRRRDIRAQAEQRYDELRAKAVDADALRSLAARVRTWGVKELSERVEKELPPELSAEARLWQSRWESAALRAAGGDYAGAAAEIKSHAAGLQEPAVQAEAKKDVDDFAAIAALRPKLKGPYVRWLPGRYVSLNTWPPAGEAKRVDGLLDQADEHRARLRSAKGPVSVEWSELTAGDLAAQYAERPGSKPKDEARLLALICLLEAAPVSARTRIGKNAETVAEKWWAFGASGRGRPRPPAREEAEARALLLEADREFATPDKLAGAVEKYRALRDRLSTTACARSAIERIRRRADAGKEHVFLAADLRGEGGVRRDAEGRWVLPRDGPGAVEFEFAALPGTNYRVWALLGGCCAETLGPQVQGTDLPPQPLIVQRPELPAKHAEHPAKAPLRWEWMSLPVPKTGAARKLRLSAMKAGFAVAAAVVSSTRGAPPKLEELRSTVEAPEVFLAEGLVAHWGFDEGAGEASKDLAGKENAALLKGAAWSKDGIVGGAVAFDGSGAHVEIPNSKPLENLLEQSYALSAWFWATDVPPGTAPANDSRYAILLKAGHHTGLGFDGSGQFAAEHWLEGGKGNGISSGQSYAPGAWHHVVSNYNRSAGTLEIFVDGEWKAYRDIPRDAKTVDYKVTPFRLGIAVPGGKEYAWPAKGLIDEVRIYSRSLGLDEIRALYRLAR